MWRNCPIRGYQKAILLFFTLCDTFLANLAKNLLFSIVDKLSRILQDIFLKKFAENIDLEIPSLFLSSSEKLKLGLFLTKPHK